MKGSEVDSIEDSDSGSNGEFLKTYMIMLRNLEQENGHLKKENTILVKQIKAKELLLTKEMYNLVKIQKELVATKLMLGKFNSNNSKLD
ncbi:hypothetical protein PVK06_003308 [Gossypium arboreum]|uniref:Uncharacterized protein n=1 Tax=Gossypium arboreum TaxID=29729 RepID=A0ABR0R724_GOSAR|nr:hypothetical protein PVK06_003308 [Gossypium arboreum]